MESREMTSPILAYGAMELKSEYQKSLFLGLQCRTYDDDAGNPFPSGNYPGMDELSGRSLGCKKLDVFS